MARYLMGTSSLGTLSAVCALIAANWILAGALLGITFVVLILGLDWAVKLHHDEIRIFRPQLDLDFSQANS